MAPPTDASLHAYIKSRYLEILVKAVEMSLWQNTLATFFTWILLSGFVVLPGSFQTLDTIPIDSTVLKKVVSTVENIPM